MSLRKVYERVDIPKKKGRVLLMIRIIRGHVFNGPIAVSGTAKESVTLIKLLP